MPEAAVSLCMIARNEEAVIARCLQSVRGAVDETIVLDTGSSDRTAIVAREEGAVVYSYEWQQHFADARNAAIAYARGEWILVLDADERLEDGQARMLRQCIADNPEADGFFVRIVNYFGSEDRQGGASVSSSLRLFRNKTGYRYEGRIHEQIVRPILAVSPHARLLYSELTLLHGGYLSEVVQRKGKVKRNTELLELELQTTDQVAFHRYNLGVEYMRAGDIGPALEQFRLSRESMDWTQASFGHVVVLREINCLQALGRWDEALEMSVAAAAVLTDYPDLHLNQARIHQHLQMWEEAEASLRRALDIGESPPQYTSVSGSGTYAACFHMGKTCEMLERYDEAAAWYAKSLKWKPTLLPPFLRLIGLLARRHEADGITERLERLFTLESPQTWWSIALSSYQLGLYGQTIRVLRERKMPKDKAEERELLLNRCRLLTAERVAASSLPPPREAAPKRLARQRTMARRSWYEAIAANDERRAAGALRQLEALLPAPEKPAASGTTDETYVLLYAVYLFAMEEQGARPHPPVVAGATYDAVWSELYFLYMLAVKRKLFALQARVRTFWRQTIAAMPDPAQRLRGMYEWIKTVHVRIYQLIQPDEELTAYGKLWDDARPKLLTLIDDMMMEETL
ncbi:glycosyltransferase [Paenibacillus cymbidii]|uniref:glycosyltransferase n=1 Tax=Paenibacillus cymbidii TaxID=1639034 RepID=UPI0014368A2D|nr:glycosyltransferase [Paenibacillus cymbidii]